MKTILLALASLVFFSGSLMAAPAKTQIEAEDRVYEALTPIAEKYALSAQLAFDFGLRVEQIASDRLDMIFVRDIQNAIAASGLCAQLRITGSTKIMDLSSLFLLISKAAVAKQAMTMPLKNGTQVSVRCLR